LLPEPAPLGEILEGEGGLARAGVPLNEVDPVGGEAAAQDVIEARDAGRDQAVGVRIPRCVAHGLPRHPSEPSVRSEGREVPGPARLSASLNRRFAPGPASLLDAALDS